MSKSQATLDATEATPVTALDETKVTRHDDTDDLNIDEVAESFRMSTRWVRAEIDKRKPEHLKFGNQIRFTQKQLAAFKAMYTVNATPASITTGRKKR